jgi:hypothetical protein
VAHHAQRSLACLLTARAARSAFLYHGFLSPEECEHIKNVARPRMERSMVRARSSNCAPLLPSSQPACDAQVVDPDTGGEKLDDIRTSFGTFLARGETDVIRQVELRVAEWAQVPEENAEQLQILRCVGRRSIRVEQAPYARVPCLQVWHRAAVQRPLGLVRPEDAGRACS